MKYDIFISCKSDDYQIGRQVYEYLIEQPHFDKRIFLADKELRKLGIADYGKAIDEALDSATHMIVVCSNPEFLDKDRSPYVYSEWHTFTEEIRSGRKKGNIMTILTNNVKIKDLPIALRNSQSFPLSDYSTILTYLDHGFLVSPQTVSEVEIHIDTDSDCKVLRFHKEILIAKAGEDNVISLRPGKHKLEFVSIENENVKINEIIEVNSGVYSDFLEIALEDAILNYQDQEYTERQNKENKKKERFAKSIIDDMVLVKGGSFTMGATKEQGPGCDKDEIPHEVTLDSFYIGKFEVTQKLWESVTGNSPSIHKGAEYPVENVSWNDCHMFISKLNEKSGRNFRLPTEAEWEYAAKGGQLSKHYKFAGGNNINDVAWCDDNSGSMPHPVGTKLANELGIHDMSGNVWEWCEDLYGSYGKTPCSNPHGPSNGTEHIFRGGSWDYYARFCRVTFRRCAKPDFHFCNLGLRLALDAQEE